MEEGDYLLGYQAGAVPGWRMTAEGGYGVDYFGFAIAAYVAVNRMVVKSFKQRSSFHLNPG